MNPKEVSSAHHVLLGGVLVALQDPDPVLTPQVFNLLHRLVSKFLQTQGPLSPKLTGSRQQPSLHICFPGTLLPPTRKGLLYLIGVPDQVSNVGHRIGLLVIREKGMVAANGGPWAVFILNVI